MGLACVASGVPRTDHVLSARFNPDVQNLCAAFPRLGMACQKEVLFIISNAAGNKDEKIADVRTFYVGECHALLWRLPVPSLFFRGFTCSLKAIVECGGIKALVQGLKTWAPHLVKALGDVMMSPVKPAEAGFPSSRVQAVKDADGMDALFLAGACCCLPVCIFLPGGCCFFCNHHQQQVLLLWRG